MSHICKRYPWQTKNSPTGDCSWWMGSKTHGYCPALPPFSLLYFLPLGLTDLTNEEVQQMGKAEFPSAPRVSSGPPIMRRIFDRKNVLELILPRNLPQQLPNVEPHDQSSFMISTFWLSAPIIVLSREHLSVGHRFLGSHSTTLPTKPRNLHMYPPPPLTLPALTPAYPGTLRTTERLRGKSKM